MCRDEFLGVCGECDPSRCSGGGGPPSPPPPSPPPPTSSPPCPNGQMRVVNNCGGSQIKHCEGGNTRTIASGTCMDINGAGQRLWAGQSNSNCFTAGNSLFEFTYPAFPDGLAWNGSLLTGYNNPFQLKDGSQTLLNVSGPQCGAVRGGLFPCTQPNGNCVPGSNKWQPICAGCSSSCCDTTDQNFDCNPPTFRSSTKNLVLTFCPA